jgi:hypothetical protein
MKKTFTDRLLHKLDQCLRNCIHYLVKKLTQFRTAIIVLTTTLLLASGTYLYGTFNPNSLATQKIIRITEQRAVDTARYLGFTQPEFKYNNGKTFIESVGKCVDYLNLMTDPHHRIPSAIIIAMAVVESAYGNSRFAQEGNALFGVRTWNPNVPQMKPLGIPNARFGVKTYKHKCDSVADMINIVNTHPAYETFRKERDKQYDTNQLNYEKLLLGLAAWSVNKEYPEMIMEQIRELKLP